MSNIEYSHEQLRGERVMVDRENGQKFLATTTHRLFLSILDHERKPVGRGAMIGIGVRCDRGFHLYAQAEHLSPVRTS